MDEQKTKVDKGRRRFIKGTAGTALIASAGAVGSGADASPRAADEKKRADSNRAAAEGVAELLPPGPPSKLDARYFGSDHMVDVIKHLGIEYVASCPGDSFRGLQESITTYGGNIGPEWLSCTHESISVGIAIGYARATGTRPMAVMMKSTVGLQNAVMAIYNAFADRVPILLISTAQHDGTKRYYWLHSAQDNNAVVRDSVKWDDTPGSLPHTVESLVRGYEIATTPPMGPVLLSVDTQLQELPVTDVVRPTIPPLTSVRYPVGDNEAIRSLAQSLVDAEFPVIAADRYTHSERAMPMLVELAELLGSAVIDLNFRYNFPTDNRLNQTFDSFVSVSEADVLLALEPSDLWQAINTWRTQPAWSTSRIVKRDCRVVVLGVDSALRSNYQDFGRYTPADEHIHGDAEATMPLLIEEVRRRLEGRDRKKYLARRQVLENRYEARRERDLKQAAIGWDSSPITTARLCMELAHAIRGEDWVLSSSNYTVSQWPQRLWTIDKPYQCAASVGASGLGDCLARAIGVALAHRKQKRMIVNIQPDGDLMFTPGALWTAAHHELPILTVVHNNRAYHQEVMVMQNIANQRDRGVEGERIGCTLDNPPIDFAQMARSMGVWAEGPIVAPDDLGPALERAVEVVRTGKPALVDVVSEPR